jgi:hypothetical protein
MPCRFHTVYSTECSHVILPPVGNHDLPTCNKILTHTIDHNEGLCSNCLDALASKVSYLYPPSSLSPPSLSPSQTPILTNSRQELNKFLTRVVTGRRLRPPFVNDWKDEEALRQMFEDRNLRIPPIDHRKTEDELRRLLEGRHNVAQREELFTRIVANRKLSVPPKDHAKDEEALRKLFEDKYLVPPKIDHLSDKKAVEKLQYRILDQPLKPTHEENVFWRERHFEGCRSHVLLSNAQKSLFAERDEILWQAYAELGESQLVFPGLRQGQVLNLERRKNEEALWSKKAELCREEERFRRAVVGL